MVALNHCQYPIPEAMIPKVKERCGEWVENQWVVLLPAGERNNWSSPLLAVNKVLGGLWHWGGGGPFPKRDQGRS